MQRVPAGAPPARPGPAARPPRALLAGLALGLAALAAGCSAVSLPPTYTPAELQLTCQRTGGWWRGDLIAGYCEYEAPGFL